MKQDFLRKDEKLLWKGQPSNDRKFCKADYFLIPTFALMLAVIYVIFVFAVRRSKLDATLIPFLLADALMALLCLYGLIFRFLRKNYIKKRCRYYITTERVIVVRKGRLRDLHIGDAARVARVTEKNRRGIGTIYLNQRWTLSNLYDNTGLDFDFFYGDGTQRRWGLPLRVEPLAFFDVSHCEDVLKTLKQAGTHFYKA